MDIDTSKDYLTSGQSKRLFAFGVLAALTVIPLLSVDSSQIGVFASAHGGLEKLVELVLQGFQRFFNWMFSLIAVSIFGVLGFLFTAGTYEFLFFKAPSQVPELRHVWRDFHPLFWMILPVSGAAFFLGQQLFPEKEEADIYRFMERTLVAVVALVVTAPAFNFPIPTLGGDIVSVDLFSAAVLAVNEIGKHIFPSSYSLVFLADSINSLMGGITVITGLGGTIIAAALLGTKFAIGVILTVAAFWLVLAMRMLLVYTVYAMMPLFLSLWVVDIGPMQYGKMVASLVFKLTAVLLLLGVVISGILATTSAIAGQGTDSELGFVDGKTYDDSVDSNVENGIVGEDGTINEDTAGETASSGPPAGFTKVLLQMFAWFGGIVLVIALTTSLLGMVISMRGGGGTSSRMRQGRNPDAPAGPQVYGGGSGGGGGAGAGAGGGAAAGTVTTTDDGSTILKTEDQGTVIDEDGSMSTFAPDPENPEAEPVTLGDKADHVTGGRVTQAKQKAGAAKQKVNDKADAIDERASERGDQFEENRSDSTVGRTVGKVGNAAISTGGKMPKAGLRAGNLAKRGGKAYGSVFMTDGAMASVGEMGRIARESPIGHPDKPQPWNKGEDGPIEEDQITLEDMDMDVDDTTESHSGAEGFGDASPDSLGRPRGAANATTASASHRGAEGYGDVSPGDYGRPSGTEDVTEQTDDEKIIGDSDNASELDDDELVTTSLGNVAENEQRFEEGRFNVENATFHEEERTDISDEDEETKIMQKGELVDAETGESFKHVGFDTNNDTPELQDGETYNLNNAQSRPWAEDKAFNHNGVSGEYRQIQVDDHTSVSKVEPDTGSSSSGSTSTTTTSSTTNDAGDIGSPDGIDLPDGKTSVVGTLEDFNMKSGPGNAGYQSEKK